MDKQTGYVIAATTDFDPGTDAVDIEREMYQVDDFDLPRAWRLHGRVWAYDEYRGSVLRGVNNLLTEGEKALSGNAFDLRGDGSRVRGDIFQAAHIMMVKKLIGSDYRQLLLCVDGDIGLAHIANMLFANDVLAGKVHVADVRFTKGLGNRKRVTLTNEGEALRHSDVSTHQKLMDIATDLPPAGPSFITRVCGFVMCYPKCSRSGLDFPRVDHTDGLAASGNFISAAGTLFPIALCGRSSL